MLLLGSVDWTGPSCWNRLDLGERFIYVACLADASPRWVSGLPSAEPVLRRAASVLSEKFMSQRKRRSARDARREEGATPSGRD